MPSSCMPMTSFLIDVLTRFVGGALAAGDAAVVIATKSHRTELEKRLSANGVDMAKAAMQGRYIALDATGTLAKVMNARRGRRESLSPNSRRSFKPG